jgi:hypothetical protein
VPGSATRIAQRVAPSARCSCVWVRTEPGPTIAVVESALVQTKKVERSRAVDEARLGQSRTTVSANGGHVAALFKPRSHAQPSGGGYSDDDHATNRVLCSLQLCVGPRGARTHHSRGRAGSSHVMGEAHWVEVDVTLGPSTDYDDWPHRGKKFAAARL